MSVRLNPRQKKNPCHLNKANADVYHQRSGKGRLVTRRALQRVALVLASVSFGACASMRIGTQPWFEEHNYGKKTLADRAAFDLSCAVAQLQFAGIGPGGDYTSVGVQGCDKKVVYVFVADKWVQNSKGG